MNPIKLPGFFQTIFGFPCVISCIKSGAPALLLRLSGNRSEVFSLRTQNKRILMLL
jgi:hypothetical protein